MILFSVGDRVWARRSVDDYLELGTIIAIDGRSYSYTIHPDEGDDFVCRQHWIERA